MDSREKIQNIETTDMRKEVKNSDIKILQYKNAFFNAKTDKLALISSILSELSYDDLNKLRKKIPSVFSRFTELKYLKRQSFEKVASNGYLISKGGNIIEYFGILAYIFEQHKEDLNLLVKLQNKFEICFLHSDYKECYSILDEIDNNVSYSYWAADLRIKLDRIAKGLNEATRTYNDYFRKNGKIQSLCYWSFKTSAIDVPFDSEVNRYLNQFQDDFYRSFIISHCFPYIDLEGGPWIYTSSMFSIVDMYSLFIQSIDTLSKETMNNPTFLRYIGIINNTIDDIRLKKYCYLLNLNRDSSLNSAERQAILIDYHINKDYSNVIAKAQSYIDNYPYDIAIMDIYIKSCILTRNSLPAIEQNSDIRHIIVHYYYNYLLNGHDSNVYKQKLRNLCEVWISIPSIKNLYNIIQDQDRNNISSLSKNYWRHSIGLNMQDITFYDGLEAKEAFLKSWSKDFYDLFNKYNSEKTLSDKTDFYDLQLVNNTIPSSELDLLTSLITDKCIPTFCRNSICSYVFNQYLQNNRIKEAVSFFSTEMVSEDYLDLSLFEENAAVINELVNSNIDRDFDNPLDCAIFFTWINTEPYKRYLSCNRYLRKLGKTKPSDIAVNKDNKLKFFLENVTDRKVLAFLRTFKNSNDVIEERIQICKNLYDCYGEKHYLEEITSLNKEQTINGFIQQVDNSKIYVDTESIKNKELKDKEFNVIFDVFKNSDEKLKILENNSSDILRLLSLLQSHGMSLTVYSGEESVEIDYKYSLFKRLYLEVRDKFVLNPKYGLDYYLSTRIRHGTIDNQLRNHLQQFHLVTNTDEEGNYNYNDYWIYRLCPYQKQKEDCSAVFNDFSRNIDTMISSLKSEQIQIKTEIDTKKTNAVFDFSSEKIASYIDSIYLECAQVTFDKFVTLIFNKLWEYTEICMQKMRDILSELYTKMRELLDQLFIDISSHVSPDSSMLSSFKDAITSCQTQLQSDFNVVQGWFQRKDILSFDFTIPQVIEASLMAINRINQRELRVSKKINSTSSFKGEYFGAFHDLLNNVLDYEKKGKNSNGQAEIIINEELSFLNVIVANPIAKEDEPNLQQMLSEQGNNYSRLISTGRSRLEGQSGFAKIYNIVSNVFESDDNTYKNYIENNRFVASININITNLVRNEDTNS